MNRVDTTVCFSAQPFLRVLSLFFFLFIGATPLHPAPLYFEDQIVRSIELLWGNETDKEIGQERISLLKTKKGHLFSQKDFDADLKSLACDFDRVEPSVNPLPDGIAIVIKVWPIPIISSISFKGANQVDASQLLKELGVKKGERFDRKHLTEGLQKVRAYYEKAGFFEVDIDLLLEEEPMTNSVAINIIVEEGRCGKVRGIRFKGFSPCEESEILALLFTKSYNPLTSWFTGQGYLNEEVIAVDQYRILTYLQGLGYIDAMVDIDLCEVANGDGIQIEITAIKGELYLVGEVIIEGNCLFSDEEIHRAIQLFEGGCYSPEALREAINRVYALYGRLGYIDAVVDCDPTLEEESRAFSLKFTINEGKQYRVGLIKVFGNHCTETRVIFHESLMVPGEIFNSEKLKRTEEKLRNIGYFKCVSVYPSQSSLLEGEECNYRDVHIEVEETGTGQFSAFFGFSNQESIFGGINITEKNFNHKGLPYLFTKGCGALRGGGEFLHFTTNIGRKSSSYVLSWTQPFFRDSPWTVGVDLDRSFNCYTSEHYRIRGSGISFHAHYPLNVFTRFSWHYRVRYTDVKVKGTCSEQLREDAKNSGLISASGIAFSYDSTDSFVCPTTGTRSRLEFEYSGLGGKHNFFSAAYINTVYVPLPCCCIAKLRGDLRYIFPVLGSNINTLPLDERLFLGGDNSVRGYLPYAIGPKYCDNSPSGGTTLMLVSLEVTRKIYGQLDGFIFFDGGDLTRESLKIDTIRFSAGFGIRLKVFENGPPLTMGFGFPLNYANRSDVRKFFWSLGGRF